VLWQKKDGRWHEVLVDVDDESSANQLRFVLSPNQTPASALLLKVCCTVS